MDEYKFASVEMIDPTSDEKRQELAQYYLDNNLNPDNDYLSRYLDLPSLPIFNNNKKVIEKETIKVPSPKFELERIAKPIPT